MRATGFSNRIRRCGEPGIAIRTPRRHDAEHDAYLLISNAGTYEPRVTRHVGGQTTPLNVTTSPRYAAHDALRQLGDFPWRAEEAEGAVPGISHQPVRFLIGTIDPVAHEPIRGDSKRSPGIWQRRVHRVRRLTPLRLTNLV